MTPRSASDICLLCLKAPADKRNSHIIPNFLTVRKDMLPIRRPAYSIPGHKRKSNGSIAVQDYIFCTRCESRISYLESYISNKFIKRYRNPAFKDEFPIALNCYLSGGRLQFDIMTLTNVNAYIFRLFCFSILWRASISTTFCASFKLPEGLEGNLRELLDKFTADTYSDLTLVASRMGHAIVYPFTVMTSRKANKYNGNIVTATYYEDGKYEVIANDLVFTIITRFPEMINQSPSGINLQAYNCLIDFPPQILFMTEEVWNSGINTSKEAFNSVPTGHPMRYTMHSFEY